MSNFDLAISIILRHEGGYVNDPNDPGGATNFGVSLRWLKAQGLLDELEQEEGDLTHNDMLVIKQMTQDEAKTFYLKYWWNQYQYGNIIPQAVANKIFDMAVNLGAPRAHRMVQSVINVTQDGVLGTISMGILNTTNSLTLIVSLQNAQARFYRSLVATNPARQKFLAGWLNRAFDRS